MKTVERQLPVRRGQLYSSYAPPLGIYIYGCDQKSWRISNVREEKEPSSKSDRSASFPIHFLRDLLQAITLQPSS